MLSTGFALWYTTPLQNYVHYYRVSRGQRLILGEARFAEFRLERHLHLNYHLGLVTDDLASRSSIVRDPFACF
jgi:hypothetical protein